MYAYRLVEAQKQREFYSASAKARRTLNHQPHTEPASADEVLPYPVAAELGSTNGASRPASAGAGALATG
jgi:hypothetical protein